MDWQQLINVSYKRAKKLGEEYVKRLLFEIKEIDKQGANDYWLDVINDDKMHDQNKNGLVLPFVMNKTEIDPIIGVKKIFVNSIDGEEFCEIDGIEITLENGVVINISEDTMIKTARGYVKAKDLLEDDEVLV